MADPNDHSPQPQKRPYEPPRILETAEFETLALACNKIPGPSNCDYIPPTSGS